MLGGADVDDPGDADVAVVLVTADGGEVDFGESEVVPLETSPEQALIARMMAGRAARHR